MALSPAGEMVQRVWHDLPFKFPSVQLDAFVCMPNHIHFIIGLTGCDSVGAGPRARPDEGQTPEGRGQTRGSAPTGGGGGVDERPSLPDVVQWYKSLTTTKYRRGVYQSDWPPFEKRFWQRNYYEQIIRNDRHLNAIRNYIANNPADWIDDSLHPAAQQETDHAQ
jgi:REP element-mobilizing transposase RayT